MPAWRIVFFPPSGERHSPYDYILALSDNVERVQIRRRLSTLSELEIGDWPHRWVHKITDDIWQLSAGDNRIMYCLDDQTMVVLHACRNVGRKTRRRDIERAGFISTNTWRARKVGKMTNESISTLEDLVAELEKGAEFRKEDRRQKPYYDLIRAIIQRRKELNLTQKELAAKVGTRQSSISRIESGEHNVRLSTLIEIAEALDARVEIRLVPNDASYRLQFEPQEQAKVESA